MSSSLQLAHAQAGKPRPKHPVILVVGDSLSAEYGLARGKGWVALLSQRLLQERPAVQVFNASISGDTSAGGRSRLPPLLSQHQPSIVVLELGANDALRGLPLKATKENLTHMVESAQRSGAQVVLVGMRIPPNYGRQYGIDFAEVYTSVAASTGVPLVPFLLKGIADAPHAQAMFQQDMMHPGEQAQPLMLDNVWPVLKPLIKGK